MIVTFLQRMCFKRKETAAHILFVVRLPVVSTSLAVSILNIIVFGVFRVLLPLALWTSGTDGEASAETTTLAGGEGTQGGKPTERRPARGEPSNNPFKLAP